MPQSSGIRVGIPEQELGKLVFPQATQAHHLDLPGAHGIPVLTQLRVVVTEPFHCVADCNIDESRRVSHRQCVAFS